MEERFPVEIVNKQPKVDDKRTKEVLLLDSELTPLQNTESEKVNKNTLNEEHFEDLSKIFDTVIIDGETSNIGELEAMAKSNQALESKKSQHSLATRKAKLLLQYCYCINVAKQFICAVCISNWELHLNAISKMLNLFAAIVYIHYTKCAKLYFQS